MTMLLYASMKAATVALPSGVRENPPSAPPAPPLPDPDHPTRVSTLSDVELRALLARYAGTPAPVLERDDLMHLYLPVLRHDFALDERYRHVPGPPLPLPIHAYAGSEDTLATPDELDGWHVMTSAAFMMRVFAGGHFFPYERGMPELLIDSLAARAFGGADSAIGRLLQLEPEAQAESFFEVVGVVAHMRYHDLRRQQQKNSLAHARAPTSCSSQIWRKVTPNHGWRASKVKAKRPSP